MPSQSKSRFWLGIFLLPLVLYAQSLIVAFGASVLFPTWNFYVVMFSAWAILILVVACKFAIGDRHGQ